MSKFTSGPWADQKGTTTGAEVIAPSATKAKRVVARCGGPDREANARLIAASPAMYEALQAIASHDNWSLNGGEGSRQCMDWMVATAKAALASADGEARS